MARSQVVFSGSWRKTIGRWVRPRRSRLSAIDSRIRAPEKSPVAMSRSALVCSDESGRDAAGGAERAADAPLALAVPVVVRGVEVAHDLVSEERVGQGGRLGRVDCRRAGGRAGSTRRRPRRGASPRCPSNRAPSSASCGSLRPRIDAGSLARGSDLDQRIWQGYGCCPAWSDLSSPGARTSARPSVGDMATMLERLRAAVDAHDAQLLRPRRRRRRPGQHEDALPHKTAGL